MLIPRQNEQQRYPYWWRYPKSPTKNYTVTLDNTNNTQANIFPKLIKWNIDIASFTTWSQSSYSRIHKFLHTKWSENHRIDITVMKICITNNVVEFDPLEKTFKEKLYRGGGVLKLVAPLLIRLHSIASSFENDYIHVLHDIPKRYIYIYLISKLIISEATIHNMAL